jgi:4-amino-4-deoxy-L-arabinose transferase-like glycosyltransferase
MEDNVTTDEFMRLLPLFAPLIAIQLVLLAVALIDLIRRPRTRGPKWAWGLAIALISIFGPLAYFLFGRSDE